MQTSNYPHTTYYLYSMKNLFKLTFMEIKFWEDNADQWNTTLESGLFKNRSITNQAILNVITQHKPQSVIDIGCGEGWISRHLRNINYTGLDGSLNLINIANKNQTIILKK